jgi:DNA replication protein DnaC
MKGYGKSRLELFNSLDRPVDGAKFKEREACIEAIDYKSLRGLKKTSIIELTQNHWITYHQNILITGPARSGKSYLVQTLGNHCARYGYSVSYLRMPKLNFQLLEAKAKGTYLDQLSSEMSTEKRKKN